VIALQIETTRFGRIEVPEETIIAFPRGLYGLQRAHHFCLLRHDEQGRFYWLQATDTPEIAMVVTDPFLHFPSYEVEIPDPACELLQATSSADVTIYTSVRVAPDRTGLYANLLGPFAINLEARIGMQLIQDATRYTTGHLLGC
jgi:flagellar assembly factor FliW